MHCFPNCSNRASTYSLFKVPSKNFCKKTLYDGAINSKKIVLEFCEDENIRSLFQCDMVKICECHFCDSGIETSKL